MKTVALIGNPNTGKTTLFNALTGLSQRTGNFPGVTVEKKIGSLKIADREVELVDLPGTYSLAANSPDEIVAIDHLLGKRENSPSPDLVIVVADASNLERNFYLTTQILECELPTILALNMHDLAVADGIKIDIKSLSRQLNCEVITLTANKNIGIDRLLTAIGNALDGEIPPSSFQVKLGKSIENAISELTDRFTDETTSIHRVEALRILVDKSGEAERKNIAIFGEKLSEFLDRTREKITNDGIDLISVEPEKRYEQIEKIIDKSLVRGKAKNHWTFSDWTDLFLIHPVSGMITFITVMGLLFHTIYSWANPFMNLIDAIFGKLADKTLEVMPGGAIESLMVNGVIAGVGGVVIFLPQILLLFGFIAILEDCGYMARVAFLMDRIMSWSGLSGRSFVPMLSSLACAVPGIMATRTIENRRDRLTTILVAPLMSCSARLPVYTLMIAAFIPNRKIFGFIGLQGSILFAMYMLGILIAILIASFLKKTVLHGETPPFVMEMPTYKIPNAKTVFLRMYHRGKAFTVRAGTIIFAVSIVIWGLTYFPRPPEIAEQFESEAEIRGAYIRQSILGRVGRFIEPAVKPLGWDWKIGMATLASFPAREVVIATLGVIYNLGSGEDEESSGLRETLKKATWDDEPDRLVFTPIVAISVMVFFALCSQCAATLAVISRETGSAKWAVFAFIYMTTLAYAGSFLTYQLGSRIIGG